jgi:hypothetical protein
LPYIIVQHTDIRHTGCPVVLTHDRQVLDLHGAPRLDDDRRFVREPSNEVGSMEVVGADGASPVIGIEQTRIAVLTSF